MTKKEIKVGIFEDKMFYKILDKLNLKQDFEKGKVKCVNCNDTITKENFGVISKKRLEIFCEKIACISKAQRQELNLASSTSKEGGIRPVIL